MKFTVFSKRTIGSAQSNSVEPNVKHNTLFQEGKSIQVCVLRGEDREVDTHFEQLKTRADLLVVELFSGNVDLPESSVNTWLHKKLAQISVKTLAVPSH